MHRLLAAANSCCEIVENVAAPGKARPLWQRDLAPSVLAIEQDTVGGAAQLAPRAGRDGEAEMRLMGRLAVVSRPIGVAGGAQFRLAVPARRKRTPRCAVGRLFGAAAFGNPAVQFIAVEEIIAAKIGRAHV